MTALNFILSNECVLISMDTLVVGGMEKRPLTYSSKIFLLPHINCTMCGVGNFDLLYDWFYFVQREIACDDIISLNRLTTKHLPEKDSKYPISAYGAIYHFGYDKLERRFKGYTYKKETGFRSEQLDYGVGFRPYPDNHKIEKLMDEYKDNPIELLKQAMILQKEENDKMPVGKKIHIGGNIQLLIMQESEMSLSNIYKFDDCDSVYDEMRMRMK